MRGGFGGMVAFSMRGGYQAALTVTRRVKVFVCAVSLGGLESLIVHPASMIHTHQSEEQKIAAGISVGLLRMVRHVLAVACISFSFSA